MSAFQRLKDGPRPIRPVQRRRCLNPGVGKPGEPGLHTSSSGGPTTRGRSCCRHSLYVGRDSPCCRYLLQWTGWRDIAVLEDHDAGAAGTPWALGETASDEPPLAGDEQGPFPRATTRPRTRQHEPGVQVGRGKIASRGGRPEPPAWTAHTPGDSIVPPSPVKQAQLAPQQYHGFRTRPTRSSGIKSFAHASNDAAGRTIVTLESGGSMLLQVRRAPLPAALRTVFAARATPLADIPPFLLPTRCPITTTVCYSRLRVIAG